MAGKGGGLIRFGDLAGAFGLLTRLPFGGPSRGAAGCWAWPVAGAVVGAIALAAGVAAMTLGMPATWAAVLVLAVQAALTGALHEDGLADTFDGLAGGRDPARRLEIMRDSRVGSFGVLALLLVVLARWSALVVLLQAAPMAVVAVAALSRAVMPVLMAALPFARQDGLARLVGRPSALQAGLALGTALAIALPLVGGTTLWLLAGGAGVVLGLGLWARARIGGQTGDILGAAQQLTESLCLGLCVAAIGPAAP
jgi:adenosylcobinamide-GDP ribazoletransferase